MGQPHYIMSPAGLRSTEATLLAARNRLLLAHHA
jgi:hypothetical protein